MNQKNNDDQSHAAPVKVSKKKRIYLGIYFVVMAFILMFFIFVLWPTKIHDGNGNYEFDKVTLLGTEILSENRLILIVMLTGAMGSYVHAATSFVTYIGNRNLIHSWTWWYILRPFIGMALALTFYFVIRGGLLASSTGANNVNLFGMAAVAALAGMFSKQATEKLREVFDNLFKTETGEGDDIRMDKLEGKLPVSDKMISLNKITEYTMTQDIKEKDVKIEDLYKLLKGVVTRIPVFDDKGAAKYVIHQSLLYRFVAEKSIETSGQAKPFDVRTCTLANFLSHPGISKLVVDSLAFVPINATLAEAKQKMEETRNCQDIFVTKNGRQDEPVAGWLTNIEIARHSQA